LQGLWQSAEYSRRGAHDLACRALIVEPSSRLCALWERQEAWTDSLCTLQPTRNFSAGRVATGGKVSYPWLSRDWFVAPYLGLYGDRRFSTDNALPACLPVVGTGNGWSARLTGSVALARAAGPQRLAGRRVWWARRKL
jgi:hypothetical protein